MNRTQTEPRTQKDAVNLPPRMKAALENYQKTVWIIKLAEGTLAALFGLMISYLVVFGLDRIFDTPTFLRGLILIAGMVGTVLFLPLKYYNWVWKHRQLTGIARLLQHKFPRFGDRVLGIVELASNRSDNSASPALIEAAMRQVDAEVAKHNLADAIPNPRHLRWVWAVALPLTLIVVGTVVIPATSRNALVRWLTPWRDVERYTFAQLEGEADRRIVAYAEPFDVQARLKEDSPWKPESAEARYADQGSVVATLDDDTYRFELPPQTKDGNVALRVGDARRSIPIEPKLRPALTELIAKVELPAYLQRQEPMTVDVRGGIVSVVKGSAATLEATMTRELAAATLNDLPQHVEGTHVKTEPIVVADGLPNPYEVRLTWRDQFGLSAGEPQILRFEAVNDAAPTVAISKLKNNQVVITDEVLAFEIQASDDFGVKKIGLVWEGIPNPVHNPEPTRGEKTVSAGTPTADTLTVAATFAPKRENLRPQSLRLHAYVEDYLPNRERIYSAPLVLHVLTPAEHFKWLIGQMQLWTEAAMDVYDKELQLHQTNRELRDLSPEALDDPAQRKRIQEQAAAERANAARLDSLIESGVGLIKEAAKNEEFDADHLESWAEILKQLEQIAGQRMPSVAELLSQASEAPGASTEQETASEQKKPQQNQSTPGSQSPTKGEPGEPNDSEQVEKYGPDNKVPPETLDEMPDDPNTPGKGVSVNRSKPADGKPGYKPANPTPGVGDVESGFNKSEDAEGQAPQVVGGLGLPGTNLVGSGRDEKAEEGEDTAETPGAADLVLEAFEEQQELIDAFAKLAEEMGRLLVSFENSTFVKRLKSASRRQIDIAVDLNNLNSFGLELGMSENRSERERLATRETNESKTVSTIIQDMAAYTDRRPSPNYLRVLAEMQDALASNQIEEIANAIDKNFVGQSTIEAEFWADTLDRWAEQLVNPRSDMPSEGGERPNLPPEIVLEVMRIIDRQTQLREETREVEQAKAALTADAYSERTIALYDTQITITEDTREVANQISLLPNAQEPLIQQQLAKVTQAADVMGEVEDILAEPNTGPEAIAAITEVIEILLQTCRIPNAPMVTTAPPPTASALALLGFGDDSGSSFIEDRSPRQATGKTGRILPAEFRQGLDAYFNVLEGR